MMMKKLIFCLLMLHVALQLWSQPNASRKELLHTFISTNQPIKKRLEAGQDLKQVLLTTNPDSFLIVCRLMENYGKSMSNKIWQGFAWSGYGGYHLVSGNLDSARWAYQKALTICPGKANELYPYLLFNLGNFYKFSGQADSALFYYHKSLPLAKKYCRKEVIGLVLNNLGNAYLDKGDSFKAIQIFQEAKAYADQNIRISLAVNLGAVFLEFNMLDEARENGLEALKLAQKLGNKAREVTAYRILAATETKDFQALENWVKKGEQIAEQTQSYRDFCYVLRIAGYSAIYDFKKYKQAEYYLNKVIQLKDYADDNLYSYAVIDLATVYLKQNKAHQALILCREIKKNIYENYKDITLINTDFNLLMSKIFEQLNQSDSSFYYLKKVDIDQLRELNNTGFNKVVSAYMEYKYAQDKLNLKHKKEAAEALTAEIRNKEFIRFWLFVLISLFFIGTAYAYYRFYQQKKKTAAQLGEQNMALQFANDKLLRFNGIVSHDILTNLDFILSFSNVIVGTKPKFENLSQYYEISQQTIQQLKHYCLQLLEEVRGAKHKILKNTDPMPIVEKVLNRFETALREAGFQIKLDTLSPVQLPPVVIEQVFQNLISNALQYASEVPNPTLSILEEPQQKEGHIQWVIADNGPGISKDRIATIFTEKKDETTTVKGRGVGLFLLQATLHMYDTAIQIMPNSDQGTKVIITF
jgi:signal transduction histidine kinase